MKYLLILTLFISCGSESKRDPVPQAAPEFTSNELSDDCVQYYQDQYTEIFMCLRTNRLCVITFNNTLCRSLNANDF